MGFEEAELKSKKQGLTCWTVVEKVGDGVDFYAPFELGQLGRVWTWHCRPGKTTEGSLALVAQVGPVADLEYPFQSTPVIDRFYPVLRNGRTSVLMNTFGWLARSGLELGDWTGYDVLRADVLAAGPVKLWLAVEDDLIEPPVVCRFDAPGGKWVTLEMDLRQAARQRDLDLSKIANFWLLGQAEAATEVRVDNIRIATADVRAALEVLRDGSSLALPAMAPPAKPKVSAGRSGHEPDRAPVKLAGPCVVEGVALAPFGWIAAYDNNNLLMGCNCAKPAGVRITDPGVMQSKDGGATWQAAPMPVVRNLDHGTARGSVVDERGDVVVVSSGPGCAGVGVATPRQFLSKYTFNGTDWDYRRPPVILDCDIRHCCSTASIIRLREGRHAGRLWAVWGQLDRFRSLCVHARFSDDDGLTWQQVGKGALVPGSRESYFAYNTYGYQQARCAPYGDGIAVFWQDGRGLMWNRIEADAWKDTRVIDPSAAALLAVTENESFRVPGSCVTRGRMEVFVTAWGVPGVLRWDGSKWQRELPDAADAGVLTLCGGRHLMLLTAGSTQQPPPYKRISITRQASVLCYRRRADGTWSRPLDLSGGPTSILEYRQMTALVAPPYSPPNFAPVAWSDDNATRIVRVPVLRD
ncbi:MAG: sialidase family protein [Phycisphaerae bacterium]